MNRAERVVRLLLELQHAGRVTTAEAARMLGVDRRKALSDLQLLSRVAPVVSVGENREREWVLDPLADAGSLGPLDSFALRIGRDALAFLRSTGLTAPLERAVKTAPGPAPLRQHMDRKLRFKTEPTRRLEGKSEIVDEVLDGLLRERTLAIEYDGKRSRRCFARLQPLTVVVFRRALYLLGRAEDRGAEERLAVDRIRACEVGERFDYPTDWDPDETLNDWWGVAAVGPIQDVELHFDKTVARFVQDRQWHPTARTETHEDGSVTLRMRTGGSELVSFVLEWGEHVEVRRPRALREAVASSLGMALALYAGEGG